RVPMLVGDELVVAWSPEHLKSNFAADPYTFGPGNHEALALIVGKGSLFLLSGEPHKRARKLLMPPFHGERMRGYGALMRESTLRWLATFETGKSQAFLPTAQGITLDIIVEAIFGERDPEKIHALHEDILAIVAAFSPVIATFKFMQRDFGGFGPWAKFRKRAEALGARMRALIAQKRTAPGEDILSLLVSARYDDGEPLEESAILDQLLTFVVAGHETTATSLAWAIYELHREPEVLRELCGVISGIDDPEALSKLPLLSAVVDEVLRMHPPVPIVLRKCTREFVLGEHTLAPDTIVAASMYNAHHREEVFANAKQFRPQRFIDKSYSPFEYAPFGGGARRCIGAAFAGYELRVVLGTLLNRATFALEESGRVGNAFRIGTYGPSTGVRVKRLT
ncbi:MAG: cytochrome P450, partial [Deltaproteobacteria bacterium]|nr:cytochrome P450 [Deltaproteobacteria bacterium]